MVWPSYSVMMGNLLAQELVGCKNGHHEGAFLLRVRAG